ncbi:MAG TPA: GNAT family N-acetyltransferase [Candidatus Saccharimonadia bacterium]|nr:GNAT family N-acetyltransferase [Candidatus Saccharimonadia bacterium]
MEFEIRQLERYTREAATANAICRAALLTPRAHLGWYDDSQVHGAFVGDSMVGVSEIYEDAQDRRRLYIARLAVDPGSQGQHVGTRLVDHAASLAIRQGYDMLSTFPATERSEDFFVSRGFKWPPPPLKDIGTHMYRDLTIGDSEQ